ncbi:MAG: hypothetical protein ACYS0E_07860 [Planctomycetota bacterium]|jgi:hypothetical protein
MQLVGLSCVRCGERIVSITDGAFCRKCGCPVHKRCATPGSSVSGICRGCGTDPSTVASTRARAEGDSRREFEELRLHHRFWGALWIIAGLALLALSAVTPYVLMTAGWVHWSIFILLVSATVSGLVFVARAVVQFRALRRLKREFGERQRD